MLRSDIGSLTSAHNALAGHLYARGLIALKAPLFATRSAKREVACLTAVK